MPIHISLVKGFLVRFARKPLHRTRARYLSLVAPTPRPLSLVVSSTPEFDMFSSTGFGPASESLLAGTAAVLFLKVSAINEDDGQPTIERLA